MAAFPASPGGALAGGFKSRLWLLPPQGWHLRLSCVLPDTTGIYAVDDREKILWLGREWLRADLPQTGLVCDPPSSFFQVAREFAGIRGRAR